MRCRSPLYLKPTKKRKSVTVPCGQCLHCRIDKRDRLVTAILLEHQAATIGQFWTLTVNDDNLHSFTEPKRVRHIFKMFCKSLRRAERKHHALQLRFFGVLEYGGLLGRPHIHTLVWNNSYNALPEEPYLPDLPRLRHQTKHWQYGHIDCCPFNLKSARYVAKYVTKFNEMDGEETSPTPLTFYPRKPTLGSTGLHLHMQRIAKGPTKKWLQKPEVIIDGKTWLLSPRLLGEWLALCDHFGLSHEYDTFGREALRIAEIEKRDTQTWTEQLGQAQRDLTKERIYAKTAEAYERKQNYLLHRALSSLGAAP